MLVIFLKYGCKKFCHLLFLTFFANFVLKFDFEKRQFQKVGVVLAEFYLFQLPLLRVLGVSYFKITKVLLNEFSPLKCLFLLILNKTSTLCNHSFREQVLHSLNFVYSKCLHCRYQRKVVSKLQKLRCTKIFIVEIFVAATFVQKIDIE